MSATSVARSPVSGAKLGGLAVEGVGIVESVVDVVVTGGVVTVRVVGGAVTDTGGINSVGTVVLGADVTDDVAGIVFAVDDEGVELGVMMVVGVDGSISVVGGAVEGVIVTVTEGTVIMSPIVVVLGWVVDVLGSIIVDDGMMVVEQ